MPYTTHQICLDCIDYLKWHWDDSGKRVCDSCGGKRFGLTRNYRYLAARVRCRRVAKRLAGEKV